MLTFLIRRLLLTIPALLGVALVVFLLMRAIPGDVVTQLVGVGQDISAERMDELRRIFGLDLPVHVQLGQWLGAALRGDLGTSLRTGRPIAGDLALRFPATFQLSLMSLAIALVPRAADRRARRPASRQLGRLSRQRLRADRPVGAGVLPWHPADPAVLAPSRLAAAGGLRAVRRRPAREPAPDDPAVAVAGLDPGRGDHPHHALRHARGARSRLRAHRTREGPLRAARDADAMRCATP
jgi:hypothetical protein